jgi:hypothetical protein
VDLVTAGRGLSQPGTPGTSIAEGAGALFDAGQGLWPRRSW